MPASRNELKTLTACLKKAGRPSGAIDKYLRDSAEFAIWLGNQKLTGETAAGWREHLLERDYAPATSIPCCPPSIIC